MRQWRLPIVLMSLLIGLAGFLAWILWMKAARLEPKPIMGELKPLVEAYTEAVKEMVKLNDRCEDDILIYKQHRGTWTVAMTEAAEERCIDLLRSLEKIDRQMTEIKKLNHKRTNDTLEEQARKQADYERAARQRKQFWDDVTEKEISESLRQLGSQLTLCQDDERNYRGRPGELAKATQETERLSRMLAEGYEWMARLEKDDEKRWIRPPLDLKRFRQLATGWRTVAGRIEKEAERIKGFWRKQETK
jgi:hypothetical protein